MLSHDQMLEAARTCLQAEKNSYRTGSEGQKHLHLHKTNLGTADFVFVLCLFYVHICFPYMIHICFPCSLSCLSSLEALQRASSGQQVGSQECAPGATTIPATGSRSKQHQTTTKDNSELSYVNV